MSQTPPYVYKYLKNLEYYSDLHDQGTIAEVKSTIESLGPKPGMLDKPIKKDNGTEMTMEEKQNDYGRVSNMIIYVTKGERYLAKAEAVKKWMDKDRKLDQRLEQVIITTKFCDKCGQTMDCTDKSYHGIDYKRIMLLYSCPDCKRIRGFFEDGEEYHTPENRCKKCGKLNDHKVEKDEKKILITDTCTGCGNIETYEFKNGARDKTEEEQQKEKERRQFLADRENYCFTEKEGEGYRGFKTSTKEIEEMFNKDKEKEKNKALYDEVAKMQKLNIAQINKLLSEGLAKENYINIQFGNPEMGREVIINFTVQENDINRKEYDSNKQLKKAIETLLSNTNWKLMSDGVSGRLGILSGRLKALEKEEYLLEMVKKRMEKFKR